MRPSVFLAIPLVLGCAQQSAMHTSTLPTDQPLRVRLHQPTAGALNYTLSEPGYVAIFAVTRGHGISLVFPHYASQADHRSHAGLNQETVHGGSGAWGYAAGARNEHRALFGHADAYYVMAAKYPLPVEAMLQSPFLLRTLVGANIFRATNFTDTWAALEEILVAGLPADDWASDVYLNWRDPFQSVAAAPERLFLSCADRWPFYSAALLNADYCRVNQTTVSTTPTGPVPVAEGPRHRPPGEPRDRDPFVPTPPDEGVARTSRLASESIRRESARRDDESTRGEGRPASDQRRGESARTVAREVDTIRRQSPPQSHPVESRPQQEPARPEPRQPEPNPDP